LNAADRRWNRGIQGCDSDCFGEIIGSIMGAYFGPGSLVERWLKPLNDDFRCSLGDFHERSLAAVRGPCQR
jgi:ADP-ribosylglycohydrolase